MKFSLFAIILCLLVSCSAPQVHLHAQYLNAEEIHRISEILDASGYRIKIRSNEFPAEIAQNTLIYSGNEVLIEPLEALFEEAGFPFQNIVPHAIANHRYTDSNVGVYLIPTGTIASGAQASAFDPSLLQEYGSLGCGNTYVLDLLPENGLVIERLSNEQGPVYQGNWLLLSDGKVEFSLERKKTTYLITKSKYDEGDKYLHLTRLTPENEQAEPLKCEYTSIIYELK